MSAAVTNSQPAVTPRQRMDAGRRFCLAIAALCSAIPAAGQDIRTDTLHIRAPVLRVAHPAAKTGAGYLTITNHGKTADRLISVQSQWANRSDLHGTVAVGAVMQMRAQADGVVIPAGATVTFAPGGLHVMFIGLKRPVPPGTLVPARLVFARAPALTVQFKAEKP